MRSTVNLIKNGYYYFIDPELKERNGLYDLGSLISYLGDYEGQWDKLAEVFKSRKLELILKEEGGKVLVGRRLKERDDATFGLDDEGRKQANFELYSGILHNCFRRLAKIRRYEKEPDQYEDQKKCIHHVFFC